MLVTFREKQSIGETEIYKISQFYATSMFRDRNTFYFKCDAVIRPINLDDLIFIEVT